jgi:hypothetical protein
VSIAGKTFKTSPSPQVRSPTLNGPTLQHCLTWAFHGQMIWMPACCLPAPQCEERFSPLILLIFFLGPSSRGAAATRHNRLHAPETMSRKVQDESTSNDALAEHQGQAIGEHSTTVCGEHKIHWMSLGCTHRCRTEQKYALARYMTVYLVTQHCCFALGRTLIMRERVGGIPPGWCPQWWGPASRAPGRCAPTPSTQSPLRTEQGITGCNEARVKVARS